SSGVNSQFVLADCLFDGNSSDNYYAAAYIDTSSHTVLLYNNTVTGNSVPPLAHAAGGLALSSANTAQASNNIFWGNTHVDFAFSANTELLSSDYGVLDGTPLTSNNNVSVDPQFLGPVAGDFHLAASSPLIAFSPLLEGLYLDGNFHPPS